MAVAAANPPPATTMPLLPMPLLPGGQCAAAPAPVVPGLKPEYAPLIAALQTLRKRRDIPGLAMKAPLGCRPAGCDPATATEFVKEFLPSVPVEASRSTRSSQFTAAVFELLSCSLDRRALKRRLMAYQTSLLFQIYPL